MFGAVCFACHGPDGMGRPMDGAPAGTMMAPPLAGSPRVQGHRDYVIKVLLERADRTARRQDVPRRHGADGRSTDEWVAGIASYVRSSFGNTGGMVTPADVARVRAETAAARAPWTLPELEASLPRPLDAQQWKLTASHGAETAPRRGDAPRLELRRAAGAGHVVHGRTAAAGGRDRGAVRLDGSTRRRPRRPRRGARSAAAPAAGRRLPARLHGAGVDGRQRRGASRSRKARATAPRTTITFAPTRAKFVRITQTDDVADAPAWSISEPAHLRGAGRREEVALISDDQVDGIPMSSCRVALANLPFPVTPEASVEQATEAIALAGLERADIICFPECFVPGYRAANKNVPPPDAAFLDRAWSAVEAAAGAANVAVVLGTERIVGGRPMITALVVDRDGTRLGFQDKVQIDPSEEITYTSGAERRTFQSGALTFGVVICHEGWRYPETVRWAARRGAQIVFHPQFHEADAGSYRPVSYADPRNTFHEKAALCRAAENTCYFATVNFAGEGSPTTSAVVRPDGTLFGFQPYGQPGLFIADLDLSEATGLLAAPLQSVLTGSPRWLPKRPTR